ncbi:MAG: hypothetical protein WKI04_17810, partial [Ferruginibacter sp.]
MQDNTIARSQIQNRVAITQTVRLTFIPVTTANPAVIKQAAGQFISKQGLKVTFKRVGPDKIRLYTTDPSFKN